MTYIEFCYWLQGFFELANPQTLTSDQIQAIKNHLDMTKVLATPVGRFSDPRGSVTAGTGQDMVKC